MTEKWADYLVSEIRYNTAETHISKVVARADNGDSVGTGAEVTRQAVISQLDAGTTYMTITKDSNDMWIKGAMIHTVTIDGERYIKTTADRTSSDNLGSLPRF